MSLLLKIQLQSSQNQEVGNFIEDAMQRKQWKAGKEMQKAQRWSTQKLHSSISGFSIYTEQAAERIRILVW